MKKIFFIILLIIVVTSPVFAQQQEAGHELGEIAAEVIYTNDNNNMFIDEHDIQTREVFGNYKVEIYRDNYGGHFDYLRILKGDEVVWEKVDRFYIGLIYDSLDEAPLVKMGNDITADGMPNLVISTWSGGAHCCYTFYVFCLGEEFRLLDEIDAGDSDLAVFKDVDDDGALEFLGRDWTFAYWNASFAGSPAPEIILKYQDGKYRLALDLMHKPLPTAEQKKEILADFDKEKEIYASISEEQSRVPDEEDWSTIIVPGIWGHMLDLIYAGHPQEAWAFLDEMWPDEKYSKERFKKEFMGRLKESNYWQELKKVFEVIGGDA